MMNRHVLPMIAALLAAGCATQRPNGSSDKDAPLVHAEISFRLDSDGHSMTVTLARNVNDTSSHAMHPPSECAYEIAVLNQLGLTVSRHGLPELVISDVASPHSGLFSVCLPYKLSSIGRVRVRGNGIDQTINVSRFIRSGNER